MSRRIKVDRQRRISHRLPHKLDMSQGRKSRLASSYFSSGSRLRGLPRLVNRKRTISRQTLDLDTELHSPSFSIYLSSRLTQLDQGSLLAFQEKIRVESLRVESAGWRSARRTGTETVQFKVVLHSMKTRCHVHRKLCIQDYFFFHSLDHDYRAAEDTVKQFHSGSHVL